MTLKKIIDSLKKQTVSNEQKFSETFGYFMTHIAEGAVAQSKSKPFKGSKFYKKNGKRSVKTGSLRFSVDHE